MPPPVMMVEVEIATGVRFFQGTWSQSVMVIVPNYLLAIKVYRERTGVDLVTAKDAILNRLDQLFSSRDRGEIRARLGLAP